jgi:deoxyribonuclease-1-like protein
MDKVMKVFGAFVILAIGVLGFFGFGEFSSDSGVRVASFNGQVFGDAKLEKVGVDYYVDLIRGYDVFFLLEIRDLDGSSFDEVCLAMGEYNYSCVVSERSGRSSSKEAVGIFWDGGKVNFSYVYSLNDSGDFFEREPVVVGFDGLPEFWVLHLKPANVSSELEALEDAVGVRDKEEGVRDGVVLIGDLNADCGYYSGRGHFLDWVWVVGDDVDTTVGATDCAYDRVVVSGSVEVKGWGVEEVGEDVSDHYLVWVEV